MKDEQTGLVFEEKDMVVSTMGNVTVEILLFRFEHFSVWLLWFIAGRLEKKFYHSKRHAKRLCLSE